MKQETQKQENESVSGRVTSTAKRTGKSYFTVFFSDRPAVNVMGDHQDLEGEKVEIELDEDGLGKNVRRIDSKNNSSYAQGGVEGSVSASKTSRIVAQGAVNLAVDNADHDYSENPEKHLAEVRKRSKAYSEMIEDLSREVENRGEKQ